MISHKYKCIFIHIPRTAGSSIEKWICGDDWWNIEKPTKHLLASQTKKLYKNYWNNYYKFSIVRNPWDRMFSCLRFSNYFKLKLENGIINISGYKKLFTYNDIILEHDYRFSKKKDLISENHDKNTIYGNILDERIDKIIKFENLNEEIKNLKELLVIKEEFNFFLNKSKKNKDFKNFYDKKSRKEVNNIFRKDIENYNYSFYDNIAQK